MKKKNIMPYNVIIWECGRDHISYYDIMPYLKNCWKDEKKRKYKTWNRDFSKKENEKDYTKMPETFDEIKKFILCNSRYMFWARCEYEVIIQDWPCQKKSEKIDVYQQIKENIDVVTMVFMQNMNIGNE